LPVRAPAFASSSRFYVADADIRLVTSRHGAPATIRYTLDGSVPTSTSPVYHRPIHLSRTTTINAKAFGRQSQATQESDLVSATFTVASLAADHGIYLSDLDESDYVGDDGLGFGGLRRNSAPHGHAIRLGGKVYEKGLMTAPVETPEGPVSWVTYTLEGALRSAHTVSATIGIDDAAKPDDGACAFIIEVRKDGSWKRVLERDGLAPNQAPERVAAEIQGGTQVRLRVEGRGPRHGWPRAVWADAKLE